MSISNLRIPRPFTVCISFCKINEDNGFKVTCSSNGEKLKKLIDTSKIHKFISQNSWIYIDLDGHLLAKMIHELKQLAGYGPNRLFLLEVPSKETIRYLQHSCVSINIDIPWRSLPTNFNKMYKYQQEDIKKIINQGGKMFVAHDMGCGKTMISLAAATLLKQMKINCSNGHFTQMVICPSYLRSNWKEEIVKWGVDNGEDIQIITKSSDVIDFEKNIIIISYDLAVKMLNEGQNINLIICDESHYLKNQKSKRWKHLQSILKRSEHLLLVSGTPALSRPEELFTQLSLLAPNIFSNWFNYTKRYCNGRHIFYGKRKTWDCSGSSNQSELSMIMSHFLVRRLKKDVLTDLPEKIRTQIIVPISTSKLKPMRPLFDEMQEINIGIRQNEYEGAELSRKLFQQKTIISKLFRATCIAKIDVCKKVLEDYLNDCVNKAVFFAVHQVMLDALQSVCVKKKTGYIRIDGNTPLQHRLSLVNTFVQQNNDIQIAILSIGACNSGFNLCPVDNMFFTELSWTPGILLQCEDRLHRIGATSQCINYKYIIADETIDERVFTKLKNKFQILDNIIDDGNNTSGFKSVREYKPSQTIQHLFEMIGIQTWNSNMVSYIPPLSVHEFIKDYGIEMTLNELNTLSLIPSSFDSDLHDSNILHIDQKVLNLNEFKGSLHLDDSSGSFYAMTNLHKEDIERIKTSHQKLELFVSLCSNPVIIDNEPIDVEINIFLIC